jgi:hypothetical protein
LPDSQVPSHRFTQLLAPELWRTRPRASRPLPHPASEFYAQVATAPTRAYPGVSGSSTVKVEPMPGALSTRTVPRWAVMISWTM